MLEDHSQRSKARRAFACDGCTARGTFLRKVACHVKSVAGRPPSCRARSPLALGHTDKDRSTPARETQVILLPYQSLVMVFPAFCLTCHWYGFIPSETSSYEHSDSCSLPSADTNTPRLLPQPLAESLQMTTHHSLLTTLRRTRPFRQIPVVSTSYFCVTRVEPLEMAACGIFHLRNATLGNQRDSLS